MAKVNGKVNVEMNRNSQKAQDVEIINQNAERLNAEAEDVLTYQEHLWQTDINDMPQNDSMTNLPIAAIPLCHVIVKRHNQHGHCLLPIAHLLRKQPQPTFIRCINEPQHEVGDAFGGVGLHPSAHLLGSAKQPSVA